MMLVIYDGTYIIERLVNVFMAIGGFDGHHGCVTYFDTTNVLLFICFVCFEEVVKDVLWLNSRYTRNKCE